MSRLSNRIDKLEKVVRKEHAIQQIRIRRLSGEDGKEAEQKYLLHQARASLRLCEPSNVIFISKRLKELREEHPLFPYGLPENEAREIIKECEDEAA